MEELIKHIVEVGMGTNGTNEYKTYAEGLDQGTRLTLGFLLKYDYLNDAFYKYVMTHKKL